MGWDVQSEDGRGQERWDVCWDVVGMLMLLGCFGWVGWVGMVGWDGGGWLGEDAMISRELATVLGEGGDVVAEDLLVEDTEASLVTRPDDGGDLFSSKLGTDKRTSLGRRRLVLLSLVLHHLFHHCLSANPCLVSVVESVCVGWGGE